MTAGAEHAPILVVFDVDNTLLDTDLMVSRLQTEMARAAGDEHATRFWEIYEEIREAQDAVNVPDTLERFSMECTDLPAVNRLSEIIYGFEFADCLFEGALDAIGHGWKLGGAAILSDGDQLWQRHKIVASGLDAAVRGRVMVQKHKELEVDRLQARFPADHYVVLDDKLRLLTAIKRRLGSASTTIHVCQGKYAGHSDGDPADLQVSSIGDFVRFDSAALLATA